MENIILFFNLFALLVLNAMWIVGFYTACYCEIVEGYDNKTCSVKLGPVYQTKMILWRVKYYSNKWFGEFWSKPICDCPPCMASIHSLWYFLFFEFDLPNVIIWVFYAVVLSGVVKLIQTKFDI